MTADSGPRGKNKGCLRVGVWMLVGIFIVVLAGLLVPASGPHSSDDTKRMLAKGTLNDLRVALKNFQSEYGRWPSYLQGLDGEAPVETQGSYLETLLAETGRFSSEDNPRALRFMDLPLARGGRGGLIETVDGVRALVDVWGSRYFVVVDVDGDGKITNPEAAALVGDRKDKEAPAELPVPVIVFSAGADKDPVTWKDNVTSWR